MCHPTHESVCVAHFRKHCLGKSKKKKKKSAQKTLFGAVAEKKLNNILGISSIQQSLVSLLSSQVIKADDALDRVAGWMIEALDPFKTE